MTEDELVGWHDLAAAAVVNACEGKMVKKQKKWHEMCL